MTPDTLTNLCWLLKIFGHIVNKQNKQNKQTKKVRTSALTAFLPAGPPLVSDGSISMQFESQGRKWERSQSTVYFVANVTKGQSFFPCWEREGPTFVSFFGVLFWWDGEGRGAQSPTERPFYSFDTRNYLLLLRHTHTYTRIQPTGDFCLSRFKWGIENVLFSK